MLLLSTSMTTSSSLFVYGTLMSPHVLKGLLDRVPTMTEPAVLPNSMRFPVKGQVFPGLLLTPGNAEQSTSGVLLQDLTESEIRALDWFEDEGYERTPVKVTIAAGKQEVPTQCYVWNYPKSQLDLERGEWSFAHFEKVHETHYLERTVYPCRRELRRLGIV
mmetsp:Transcript_27809/g.64408  ORF Transcript_27809/g.64408 Transcript_27809/m.64408 type:complete len:162 (-) Transcript_27809:515-1000(-)